LGSPLAGPQILDWYEICAILSLLLSYISEMVQTSANVTIQCEYEVMCDLLNFSLAGRDEIMR